MNQQDTLTYINDMNKLINSAIREDISVQDMNAGCQDLIRQTNGLISRLLKKIS